MATLILAGVPGGVFLQHRNFQVSVPGWSVQWIKSKCKRADLTNSWPDVLAAADKVEDGAHIFAFHSYEDGRSQFEGDVYARHRLLWLDRVLLKKYGDAVFNQELAQIAAFEEAWRIRIKPSYQGDPLVLPESSFKPLGGFDDTWRRAQRVRLGWDNLEELETALRSFRKKHGASGDWVDRRDLIFNGRQAKHAVADLPWRWKYTYLVHEQFHFDVRHKHHSRFELDDRFGVRHHATGYVNVDCHGRVRGA